MEPTDLVVQSNRLVEASYRLSMGEQQVVLYAVVQGREKDILLPKNETISIDARDFGEKFNISPKHVYERLQEACDHLFDRWIRIDDVHPKTGLPRVVKTRWVSDVAYIEGAGTVELTFAKKILPYITRLEKEFTQYRLEKIGHLTSPHSVRLYELMVQYLGVGKRMISLDDLKESLGLTGEYPAIKDFKLRVLEPAIKAINEHTDIKIKYEQKRTGRVITDLIFTIKAKPEAKTQKKQAPIDSELIAKEARPGESRDDAYQRLKKERAAKNKTTKKPEQMTLPECAEPPRNPQHPHVERLRNEALDAAKVGTRPRWIEGD